MTLIRTQRGHLLMITRTQVEVPTITVELYMKWYGFYVVRPDHSFEEISFLALDEGWEGESSPYVDHVPNPEAVIYYARARGYEIDDLSLEVMIGRWEHEVKDRYHRG